MKLEMFEMEPFNIDSEVYEDGADHGCLEDDVAEDSFTSLIMSTSLRVM